MRFNPLHLVSGIALGMQQGVRGHTLVVLALSVGWAKGCVNVRCEDLGNCDGTAETAATNSTSGTSSASSNSSSAPIDVDASPATRDASPVSSAADAHITPTLDSSDAAPVAVDCTVSSQCPAATPVCDGQRSVCVQCLGNEDCSAPDSICSQYTCQACDLDSNAGCEGAAPVCVETDGRPRACVECATHSDCTTAVAGQACYANACTTCAPGDSETCPTATPVCVSDEASPSSTRCVECASDADCPSGAPVCLADQCVVCDLDTHAGCGDSTPYCVAEFAVVATPQSNPDAPDGGTPDASVVDASGLDASAMRDAAPSDASFSSGDSGSALAALSCVQCRSSGDCSGEAGVCLAGACVECTADSDCTDAENAHCDVQANACTPCTAPGQCAHLGNTPACETTSGTCVECTAEETEACGTKACTTIPGNAQYSCSAQNVNDAYNCEPCVSDAACEPGLQCIADSFAGQQTGWYCLKLRPEAGTCSRPFSGLVSTTSADGVSGAYCRPAYTTCAGYLDYGTGGTEPSTGAHPETCTSHDFCGAAATNDGYCVPRTSGSLLCTYPCDSSADCTSTAECKGDPAVGDDSVKVCLPL